MDEKLRPPNVSLIRETGYFSKSSIILRTENAFLDSFSYKEPKSGWKLFMAVFLSLWGFFCSFRVVNGCHSISQWEVTTSKVIMTDSLIREIIGPESLPRILLIALLLADTTNGSPYFIMSCLSISQYRRELVKDCPSHHNLLVLRIIAWHWTLLSVLWVKMRNSAVWCADAAIFSCLVFPLLAPRISSTVRVAPFKW